MARPPVYPINGTEDYFDKVITNITNYFGEDKINLDFSGYKETVIAYGELELSDPQKCFELSVSFNMWGDYFSNLKSLTEKMYLDAETEKKREFASSSITEDAVKVANGDRLANKNPNVVSIRKKRNDLKAFLTAIDAKIDFCYKAHHHCKDIFKWLQTPNTKLLTT